MLSFSECLQQEHQQIRDADPKYKLIKHQLERARQMNQPIHFGSKVNILLVADKVHLYMAEGLEEYLGNSADITVHTAYDLDMAREIIKTKPLDLMIIVGCFQRKRDYSVVDVFEYFNQHSLVILYTGMKDPDLLIECAKHKIFHTYSCHDSLEGLVSMMQALHVILIERVNALISKSALKEQIWNQLLPNLADEGEVIPDNETEPVMMARKEREQTTRRQKHNAHKGSYPKDYGEKMKTMLNETLNTEMIALVRRLAWYHRVDSLGILKY